MPSNRHPKPISLSIDVTEKCNFNCVYCYKGEKEYRTLDYKNCMAGLEKIWPVVKARKAFNISFMGGEPLMEFGLAKKIVEETRKKCQKDGLHFSWGMTSNGSLLDEKRAREILSARGHFHFSMDGRKISQDFNRPIKDGQGSFKVVRKNIPFIKRAGGRSVRLTVSPFSAGQLVENISFLAKKKFESIAAYPAIDRQTWTASDLENLRREYRTLGKMRYTKLKGVKSLQPFDTYAYAVNYGITTDEKCHHCGVQKSVIGMDINGRFFPCHRFSNNKAFERFEITSFGDEPGSWEHSKKYFAEQISNRCKSCEFFGACRGGCWAENAGNTGEPSEPSEIHCKLIETTFKGLKEAEIKMPPKPMPTTIPISGEGHCILTDICVSCDCSTCGKCDRCEKCDVCERCDSCLSHEKCTCDRCDHCESCMDCTTSMSQKQDDEEDNE